MPTKNRTLRSRIDELEGRDRVERSEPGERAQLDAIARAATELPGRPALPQEVVEQTQIRMITRDLSFIILKILAQVYGSF